MKDLRRPTPSINGPRSRGPSLGLGEGRRPRRPCVFLFLALLSAAPLSAQQAVRDASPDVAVLEQVFLPARYYVGDEVELRLLIAVEAQGQLVVPSEEIRNSHVVVRSIALSAPPGACEITVRFVSYAPGPGVLPDIDLGGIVLGGIPIRTASLVEEGQAELKAPRGQLLLPNSVLRLAISVAVVAVLPFLLVFSLRRLRRLLDAALVWFEERKPYARLRRVLSRFRRELMEPTSSESRFDERTAFERLADAFRAYLSFVRKTDCACLTTRELETIIREPGVIELFHRFDETRFGYRQSNREEIRDDLRRIEAWVRGARKEARRRT